jgi:hypothetical protein
VSNSEVDAAWMDGRRCGVVRCSSAQHTSTVGARISFVSQLSSACLWLGLSPVCV